MSTSEVPNLSKYSTAEELDLLFNEKDGILPFLADDTFIGIMGDESGDFELDKAFDADDLFSQVIDEPHVETSHDHPYSKDQQLSRSPLNSDSGISDSCQRSPYSDMQSEPSPGKSPYSDLQSEPSPGRSSDDGSNLEEVILDTIDLSCMLTGDDTMLSEDDTVTTTTQDIETVGFSSNLRLTPSESTKDTLPFTIHNTQTTTPPKNVHTITPPKTHCEDANSRYHLTLTDEEKKLLADMNVTLPTDMPLTKEEERALKAVRRKIRNKASAQNSRKRKKEYVDGLEHRVQLCTRNNLELQKKMDKLEKENRSLLDQLKMLQKLVAKSTNKAAQASTCVMVLLFSFALLVAPSFNPFSGSAPEAQSYSPTGVTSRTLKHVDVGDTGLIHEEVNLGTPPQSFADENPKVVLGRRSVMTQSEEDVDFDESGKEMVNNEKKKSMTDEEHKDNTVEGKTVVNSPNEAQRNSSQTVTLKDNVKTDKKLVTDDKQDVKRKHRGDEM